MRKIKDLCTVVVENAFRLHPIDEERYELFVRVLDEIIGLKAGGLEERNSGVGVQEWFSAVQGTLILACQSYWSVYAEPERFTKRGLELAKDRSDRLIASADRCGFGADLVCARQSDDLPGLVAVAWTCVLFTMRTTPGFLSGQQSLASRPQ